MVADKPAELYMTALTRARFCQLAGQSVDGPPDQLFTLGLFSVIDALTDTSMEAAADALPLPPRLRNALVNRTGPGRLLSCVEALERGQFDRVARQLAHPARDYTNALAWANATTAGMRLNDDATDGPLV
jgi:c-di-GMP-related signal transduction protein